MMARLNNPDLRTHESPMDWKYDQGHGPTDKDSPFPQAPANGRKYNTFAGQKRSAQDFDSPTKASLPALGNTDGQAYLFSPTPSSKPQLRNPSFTTPQRSIETEFSSGPDQSSPVNADTEDTPDPPARSVLSKANGAIVPFAGSNSEKKASSQGLFGKFTSSGKGEIARKPYTDVLSRRVEKRRRRDVDRDVRSAPRRSSNDSGFEERSSSSKGQQQKHPPAQPMGFVPSVLTFIDAHPSLPNTLSFYVQFLFNCFFAFCMMYVLFGIYWTICNDIEERTMMESSEILAEMAVCAREFKENRCERGSRVPAMEIVCNNWEKCMQRDPHKVGRTRLSAGIFAEIFNGFIEPISLKAIIVSVTVIVGCFAVNNLTFGVWRAKTHQQPHPQHIPYTHPPHQQPIDYQMTKEHYYTPYQNHMGMYGMSEGYQAEGPSPSKRLGYR